MAAVQYHTVAFLVFYFKVNSTQFSQPQIYSSKTISIFVTYQNFPTETKHHLLHRDSLQWNSFMRRLIDAHACCCKRHAIKH